MSEQRIHVAAAAIYDPRREKVFLTRRLPGKHQAGKWEFPGGKVDAGETVRQALYRELDEETGIEVTEANPLIQVRHEYPDISVLLDVWAVTGFSGEPHGREGQEFAWVGVSELRNYQFPEANLPIVKAVELPARCLITPDCSQQPDFAERLEDSLQRGVRLIVFRSKQASSEQYLRVAEQTIAQASRYNAKVILNSPPAWITGAWGIHLTSDQLHRETEWAEQAQWLSASCHNRQDLQQAEVRNAQFALLSPVQATASHPQAKPLGWEAFSDLVRESKLPIYALGGMQEADINPAREHGGQGIAALSGLWGTQHRGLC